MSDSLVILRYPPDYDGELHIHVQEGKKSLTVHLAFAIKEGERIDEAIRRLGAEMQKQPISVYQMNFISC